LCSEELPRVNAHSTFAIEATALVKVFGTTRAVDGPASIGELGRRLGYESEAAFSRAFKRYMNETPGAAHRDTMSGASGISR
jgi:AraC-like DNA-binding protein